MTSEEYKEALAAAYDRDAPRRDEHRPERWRLDLLDELAAAVRGAGGTRLVELGAGTGQMAAHLAATGLEVLAVDLSPENVERCRARGIDAVVGDLMRLDLPADSFDGGLAFNSLLHVPRTDLLTTLDGIAHVLRPGAPFLMVVWGGADWEGILDGDGDYAPRFFSFLSDEAFVALQPERLEPVSTAILDHVAGRDHRHPQVRMYVRT